MVLGIENRTENWKTARCLRPFFFGDMSVRLARELGEPWATSAAEVKLELYWKGVRDWCVGRDKRECEKQLVESGRRLFRDLHLRQRIERYDGFRDLRPLNYEVPSEDQKELLVNNLVNTEIDIVLESPGHLYIGEAKYKSGFHANGGLLLVHQLVRQYVMANVLVDVLRCDRQVVPFVVTEGIRGASRFTMDAGEPARSPHQVQFMIEQGWMSEGNCLTWDTLATMASERPRAGIEE